MLEALLSLGFSASVVSLCGIWWIEHRTPHWSAFELRFPSELTVDDVVRVGGMLSGLGHGSTVVLELDATGSEIVHRLLVPTRQGDELMGKFHALIPALRFSPTEIPTAQLDSATGVNQRSLAALRSDSAAASSAAILSVAAGLRRDERLVMQWMIGGGFAPAPRNTGEERTDVRAELRQARREKTKFPLVRVHGRIGVTASTKERRRCLHRSIISTLRSLSTPHGELAAQTHFQSLRADKLSSRRLPLFGRPMLLNSIELASVIGWPVDGAEAAGLRVSGAPLKRASDETPHHGRSFGESNFPGSDRQVAQSSLGLVSHTLVAGPTGSGKSVLLSNLLEADMRDRRSVVVIDGKGDLAERVLERVPEERLSDVRVLDLGFGDSGTPVAGLKLFGRRDDAELAADLVLGVMADLFADSWGPRSEQWLRVGLATVATDSEATLADLPFLFSDDSYRRKLVGRLDNPLLRSTWAQFEAMGTAERNNVLAAPLNKLDAVLGRSRLRAVLAQRHPAIDVAEVMNGGGILIVNLATGSVGTLASRLLGALVVFEIYRVTSERSRLAAGKRRAASVVIDEPRTLLGLPIPLDVMFEQARGNGVGVTVAAQSVSQLPEGIARSMMSNVGTIAAFRQNADDAQLLARQFAGMSAADLQGLDAFEIVVRMGLGNGRVTPPLTVSTTPLSDPLRSSGALVRQYVSQHGLAPADVDAELFARHQHEHEKVEIGRKRRAA